MQNSSTEVIIGIVSSLPMPEKQQSNRPELAFDHLSWVPVPYQEGNGMRDSQRSKVLNSLAAMPLDKQPVHLWEPAISSMLTEAWLLEELNKTGKFPPYIHKIESEIVPRFPSVCRVHVVSSRKVVLCLGTESSWLDVAHRIAHLITPADEALHGPEFAKRLLLVTERMRGRNARTALRTLFVGHGVKYRTWSPEARERARERAQSNGTPFTRVDAETQEAQKQDIILMVLELQRRLNQTETEES